MKFNAIWILSVLANTTCCMEKQKQCGKNSGLRSFKKLQTRICYPHARVHTILCPRTTHMHRGGGGGQILLQFFAIIFEFSLQL